jgi:hypothetical protein
MHQKLDQKLGKIAGVPLQKWMITDRLREVLKMPTLVSTVQWTENHLDKYGLLKSKCRCWGIVGHFFSINWVFICLASSSARDVKEECQTWRRSPLKRDDCAVSGWMTMAPSA